MHFPGQDWSAVLHYQGNSEIHNFTPPFFSVVKLALQLQSLVQNQGSVLRYDSGSYSLLEAAACFVYLCDLLIWGESCYGRPYSWEYCLNLQRAALSLIFTSHCHLILEIHFLTSILKASLHASRSEHQQIVPFLNFSNCSIHMQTTGPRKHRRYLALTHSYTQPPAGFIKSTSAQQKNTISGK